MNTYQLLLVMVFAAGVASAGDDFDPGNYTNPNGETTVVVADDPTQSYELYVPLTLPATGPYSIFYGFDPTANGKYTLSKLHEVAAEQQWILAVSNNSSNTLLPAESYVVQDALVRDTEARLDLHPTRRFAGGFSGASMSAMIFAYRYPEYVVGVLGLGGGDAGEDYYPVNPKIAVYMLSGRSDPQFWYMGSSQRRLLWQGYRCYAQPFTGAHVWPSTSLLKEGAAWIAQYAGTDAGADYEECDPMAEFANSPYVVSNGASTSIASGNTYSSYQYIGPLRGRVTAVTWWGTPLRYNSSTQQYSNCVRTATESFRVAFMLDNGGVPGNAFAAQTVTPTRVYAGQTFSPMEIFRYRVEFAEPIDTGDAEWLRIACMPISDGCGWLWAEDALPEPVAMQVYLPDAGDPAAFYPLDTRLSVCVETDAPLLEGEGVVEGMVEGAAEGDGAQEGEGLLEGEAAAEGMLEGTPEGVADGEGAGPDIHTTDINADQVISLSELLRVVQLFSYGGYHCAPVESPTEDGLAMGDNPAAHACAGCSADYAPKDWSIDLGELLRVVQLYNSITGYGPCVSGEDGFCLL